MSFITKTVEKTKPKTVYKLFGTSYINNSEESLKKFTTCSYGPMRTIKEFVEYILNEEGNFNFKIEVIDRINPEINYIPLIQKAISDNLKARFSFGGVSK